MYFSHPTMLKNEGCFEQLKRTVTQQHAVPTTAVVLLEDADVAQQTLDDMDDTISRGSSQENESTGDDTSSSSSSTSGSTNGNVSETAAAHGSAEGGHRSVGTIGGADETSSTINARGHADGQDDHDQKQSLNSCTTVLILQVLVETLKGKIALMHQKNHRILAENRALLRCQADMMAVRGQHEATSNTAEGNSSQSAQQSRNKVFANDLRRL